MACLRKPRVREESTSLDQQKLLSNGDTLERSLPGFLLQEAAQHANSGKINWMINAVTDDGVSFADFDRLSRNAASWLCKKGISKGDCVWVSLSATERLHCVLNGVWIANGVVRSAFLEDASTMNEGAVVEKLKELKIKMIFCNITNAAFYLSVALKVDWPVYILTNGDQQGCVSLRELFEDDGLDVPALEMKPEDPALMFSSVTSSTDIVHSHKAVISMIKNFQEFIPFHERPLLISSNLTHVIGVLCPLTLLVSGRTGLMIPKPERRDLKSVSRLTQKYLQKTIDKYRPNAIIGLPSSLNWICKTELMEFSSIEYLYTGGGPKSKSFSQVVKCLPNFKRNVTGYWLKEFGIVACNSNSNVKDGVPLSLFAAGKPLHDVSVEIHDVRTRDPLGCNVKGEIVVRSNIASLSTTTSKGDSADICFSSGDLGFFDAQGILHVTDSIQDIIEHKKNHCIFPSEIEDALAQYPGVDEACVFNNISNNNCKSTQKVMAAVKVSPDADFDANIFIAFAKNVYDQFDCKTDMESNIVFLEELPKEKSGKFSRELIARMVSERSINNNNEQ